MCYTFLLTNIKREAIIVAILLRWYDYDERIYCRFFSYLLRPNLCHRHPCIRYRKCSLNNLCWYLLNPLMNSPLTKLGDIELLLSIVTTAAERFVPGGTSKNWRKIASCLPAATLVTTISKTTHNLSRRYYQVCLWSNVMELFAIYFF